MFTPDARCDDTSMTAFPGGDICPAGCEDIERWMRRSNANRPSMHVMHHHMVHVVGAGHARMRNYLPNANSSITGIYETEARRTETGWRFTSLRLDERSVDTARLPPPAPGATPCGHLGVVDGTGSPRRRVDIAVTVGS